MPAAYSGYDRHHSEMHQTAHNIQTDFTSAERVATSLTCNVMEQHCVDVLHPLCVSPKVDDIHKVSLKLYIPHCRMRISSIIYKKRSVTGLITATINPDNWVPKDRLKKTFTLHFDLPIVTDSSRGRYVPMAQMARSPLLSVVAYSPLDGNL